MNRRTLLWNIFKILEAAPIFFCNIYHLYMYMRKSTLTGSYLASLKKKNGWQMFDRLANEARCITLSLLMDYYFESVLAIVVILGDIKVYLQKRFKLFFFQTFSLLYSNNLCDINDYKWNIFNPCFVNSFLKSQLCNDLFSNKLFLCFLF